ncbi:hypothetical protein FUA83_20465 [Salmonella enterica]|nr:hypothetical protein [Salmonella enterica]
MFFNDLLLISMFMSVLFAICTPIRIKVYCIGNTVLLSPGKRLSNPPFFNERPLKTGAVNAFYVKSLTLIR